MEKPKQDYKSLPDLLAPLQLDRYLVDDLIFKCNAVAVPKGRTPQNPTISVDFDWKVGVEDKNRFLMDMKVDLNEGQKFEEFEKHQIHLHLYGWFTFTQELDEQTKAKMLATNASAMLYGIARSVVGNLTGSFGSGRYTLPVLNLLSVVKAKAEEQAGKKKKVTARPPRTTK